MNVLVLVTLANIVVWGVIVGLMFRLAGGERELSADLSELERQLGDD